MMDKTGSGYVPRLHLPPWFEEEAVEDTIAMKEWTSVAFVELEDGSFVQPEFISISRVTHEMAEKGYYLWSETVILDICTLDRIREVLPELAMAGAFNRMTRYSSPEWK